MVDSIIVLKDGTISESGSYEELLSYNGDFAEFLQQYLQQDEEESDEDPESKFTIALDELSFFQGNISANSIFYHIFLF